MTATTAGTTNPDESQPSAATAPMRHPLDSLTAEEIRHARAILVRAGLVGETTRFPLMSLAEPSKAAVLDRSGWPSLDRVVETVLLDAGTGEATLTQVSLTEDRLLAKRAIDVAADGQPPLTQEEMETVGDVVKADQRWRAAITTRGITDVDLVCVCPLSAGNFDLAGEHGRRLVRCLSFARNRPTDSPWAHPIDGLVAYVDLISRTVVDLLDREIMPVPLEEGNFDPDSVAPLRSTLRPIEITQPEGPSFSVDGHLIRWEKWSFRLGFNAREGLTLHEVGFDDDGRTRLILYRASVAEMVVPYGDPSSVRFWQNYFDTGEYNLGKQTNSLVLGCDCLGEITYFDAVLADDLGNPQTFPNAVCMHEEDFGILWKHTDMFTGVAETRRQRRLVVSFFVTVGNYDYGFYWYFYLDGTIQLECKATGVVFTSSFPGKGYRWASEIAPGLGAPFHQHLFSARLDFALDGVRNAVDEVDAQPTSSGAENPWGNAIERKVTRLRRESDAARLADNRVARTWQIVNPSVRNRLGEPIGYALCPQGQPPLLAQPDSSIGRRATFASKHLWVTRYDPTERFPAGEFVNQHPGGAGLPTWTTQDRSIDDADIVVWHTFGLTHFPRPEDWPIMPVDYCGFTLKPVGFFDRNPSLDVAPSPADHCHHH